MSKGRLIGAMFVAVIAGMVGVLFSWRMRTARGEPRAVVAPRAAAPAPVVAAAPRPARPAAPAPTRVAGPFVPSSMIRQVADDRISPHLTDDEARVLDAAFKDLTAQREALELSLAQKEEVQPGTVLITIPEYREKGRALLAQFSGTLAEAMGGPRADQVTKAVTPFVRAENGQLGDQEQNILVEDKGDMFHVVRGIGPLAHADNRPALAHVTVAGNVRPDNLSIYTYLAPLFPTRPNNNNKTQ